MEWVKLTTSYYRDLAVATGDDAMEVMFTRGNALAGETESSGFIPDALLHTLTRRPQHATRTARALVRAELWETVPGGYQIVNWARIQDELEKLVARKRRDRDRKRTERRTQSTDVSVDESTDTSTDSHTDRLYESERKSKKKTAAAAAVDPAAAAAPVDNHPTSVDELPTAIAILRDKLQAHTALQALRFDGLALDKQIHLEALIERHGDQRLVDTAMRTLRTPPPVHVAAFLGTWEALPAPGQRLAVVKDDPCPQPGHAFAGGTTRSCNACAAEAKAAR